MRILVSMWDFLGSVAAVEVLATPTDAPDAHLHLWRSEHVPLPKELDLTDPRDLCAFLGEQLLDLAYRGIPGSRLPD